MGRFVIALCSRRFLRIVVIHAITDRSYSSKFCFVLPFTPPLPLPYQRRASEILKHDYFFYIFLHIGFPDLKCIFVVKWRWCTLLFLFLSGLKTRPIKQSSPRTTPNSKTKGTTTRSKVIQSAGCHVRTKRLATGFPMKKKSCDVWYWLAPCLWPRGLSEGHKVPVFYVSPSVPQIPVFIVKENRIS